MNFTAADLGTRKEILTIGLCCGLFVVGISTFNGILMYDDLYLVSHFKNLLANWGLARSQLILFFNLDLGVREYRTYGLAKVIHFWIWAATGSQGWLYGGLIGFLHVLLVASIQKVLWSSNVDRVQATAICIVCLFSPFAVTTTFHHYGYLQLPVLLTLLAGLTLQRILTSEKRSVGSILCLLLLSFAIAETGEAHIPVTFLILAAIAGATPGAVSFRQRVVWWAVACSAIVAILVVHRLLWATLVTDQLAGGAQRYVFTMPTLADFIQRSRLFFTSLQSGITDQLGPILDQTRNGPAALILLLTIGGSLFLFRKFKIETASKRGIGLALLLFSLFAASLLLYWLLSALTGQVRPAFPRRYGYVPYTLLTMTIVAFLTAPAVRRRLGVGPAAVASGFAVGIWAMLTCICLPTVRHQDAKIWNLVASTLHAKPEASVLFVSASHHYRSPDFTINAGMPGLRGSDFPEVFESPLSGYWWQSAYATVVVGARYAALRAEPSAAGVRLYGNELVEEPPSIETSNENVIVLADMERHSLRMATATTKNVQQFDSWDDYQQSIAAIGVTESDSSDFPPRDPSMIVETIDLGATNGKHSIGLPDKGYDATPIEGSVIRSYGSEGNGGDLFDPYEAQPFSYFLSNRNGRFTYRIDFADTQPKEILLDWLDFWHRSDDARRMLVDVALDGHWYRLGVVNVARESSNGQLTIAVPTGSSKTFQVRFSADDGATDIPFLNGIRVSRRVQVP